MSGDGIRRRLLVQSGGLVLRGVCWGVVYGAATGAVVGTLVFPGLGTLIGAVVGMIIGAAFGLACGVVLAGYTGIGRGCLHRDRVALAHTFPLVTLLTLGAGTVVYWALDPGLTAFLALVAPPTVIIMVAAGWCAARSMARWYLRAGGYTPDAARAALNHFPR
ncbi:MAG TPA: hypothetical protein VFX70_21355 [Mycobacteriales bacterium]|nr:hypothetical protein [Mycobacteriales bacterium]